ncbi:head completion protein [uncultured Caudovirales phage]|jgi:hypothetical protein|uniref:Head completion nuclease n=1 Tax=uncultured Caudovirales phage TaxID=2100421 RepID=A0A6J5SWK0_9CAUD|nr:head completion protein [uncultured Caudovirales phage]
MKPKEPKKIQDFLKPRAGKIRQGYFKPAQPEKYLGDPNNIVFRSSWEFKFLKWCDSSPTVIKYASEPIGIPYYSPLDKRAHTYYIDFLIIVKDASGLESKYLIEVKPDKYTKPPTAPARMTDKQTANYVYAAKQYIVNQAKFEAAKEFASVRGLKFGIITENFLFKSI